MICRMNHSDTKGIIYIANGKQYVDEAAVSARSAKACMPHIPITLFTNAPPEGTAYFDRVETLDEWLGPMMDKIRGIQQSPYEQTLYLDSDTYVVESFDEIFDVLNLFDIAVAHDTWRQGEPIEGCPHHFSEFNTGVILYRNSPETREALQQWKSLYSRDTEYYNDKNDQPAFRRAVYESDARIFTLTSEYNYTVWAPGFAGAFGRIKILHGRNKRLDRIAKWVNNSKEFRVFVPSVFHLQSKSFGILSPAGRFALPVVRLLARLAMIVGRRIKGVNHMWDDR